jgi:hypothetical protein
VANNLLEPVAPLNTTTSSTTSSSSTTTTASNLQLISVMSTVPPGEEEDLSLDPNGDLELAAYYLEHDQAWLATRLAALQSGEGKVLDNETARKWVVKGTIVYESIFIFYLFIIV